MYWPISKIRLTSASPVGGLSNTLTGDSSPGQNVILNSVLVLVLVLVLALAILTVLPVKRGN
jgi:hypothetical protein